MTAEPYVWPFLTGEERERMTHAVNGLAEWQAQRDQFKRLLDGLDRHWLDSRHELDPTCVDCQTMAALDRVVRHGEQFARQVELLTFDISRSEP